MAQQPDRYLRLSAEPTDSQILDTSLGPLRFVTKCARLGDCFDALAGALAVKPESRSMVAHPRGG